ncbi:MAG: hypothetical protein ACI9MC_001780, partial [Kiritimatiellia bacterium]
PRSRARLVPQHYYSAWDDLFAAVADYPVRALHHTALNLASSVDDRADLLAFTNELIDRYDLRWVNEDLGFWSLDGRALPYPLPPVLTDAGLATCVRNAISCREGLHAPLLLEFPGFSNGWSLCVGDWDAYDFFREVVQRSDCPCTLDVAHLLSWRWLQGHRGQALFDDLDRLPLDSCFELHMSGVELRGDRFVDAHHGVLIDAQFEMLRRLRERCANLGAITYEDPVFDERGVLDASNVVSLERLVRRCAEPVVAVQTQQIESELRLPGPGVLEIERGLGDVLYDVGALARLGREHPLSAICPVDVEALGREVRRAIGDRRGLGQKTLRDRFAPIFSAWDRAHPDQPEGLLEAFGQHPASRLWADVGMPERISLEEAFCRFVEELELVDVQVVRRCLYSAIIEALAIDPHPNFAVPDVVTGGPGAYRIIDHGPPARLYAVAGSRVIGGPLPPLALAILRGEGDEAIGRCHGLTSEQIAPVRARLQTLGLMAV